MAFIKSTHRYLQQIIKEMCAGERKLANDPKHVPAMISCKCLNALWIISAKLFSKKPKNKLEMIVYVGHDPQIEMELKTYKFCIDMSCSTGH